MYELLSENIVFIAIIFYIHDQIYTEIMKKDSTQKQMNNLKQYFLSQK